MVMSAQDILANAISVTRRKIEPQIPNSSPQLAAALEQPIMRQGFEVPCYTIKQISDESCNWNMFRLWAEQTREGPIPYGTTVIHGNLAAALLNQLHPLITGLYEHAHARATPAGGPGDRGFILLELPYPLTRYFVEDHEHSAKPLTLSYLSRDALKNYRRLCRDSGWDKENILDRLDEETEKWLAKQRTSDCECCREIGDDNVMVVTNIPVLGKERMLQALTGKRPFMPPLGKQVFEDVLTAAGLDHATALRIDSGTMRTEAVQISGAPGGLDVGARRSGRFAGFGVPPPRRGPAFGTYPPGEFPCILCGGSFVKAAFSKAQLKRKRHAGRKCRSCVARRSAVEDIS